MVGRTFIPVIAEKRAYVSINGPLAFDAMFPGTGLVSIATGRLRPKVGRQRFVYRRRAFPRVQGFM